MLDLIDDEEVVVVLSSKGYIKTVAADAFRRQGRGGRGVRGGNLRDEDFVEHLLTTTAHSYLLFFSNRGRVVPPARARDPDEGAHRAGTRSVNLLALDADEHIQAVIDTRTYEDGAYLFFATTNGMVKKTQDAGVRLLAAHRADRDQPQRRRRAGARWCRPTGDDDMFLVSRGRHDDPVLRGRRAGDGPGDRRRAGHEAEEQPNDAVVSCDVARDDAVMLFVSSSGHGKRTTLDAFNRQGRGGQGVRGMKITAARGEVVAAFTVAPDDEILVFSSGGNLIRMGVKEISAQGRDATGVRVPGWRR